MRLAYTSVPLFGVLPRPYVRLIIRGQAIDALIDTGSDDTVLSEAEARGVRVRYEPSGTAVGVGGEVHAFRASERVEVTILAPRQRRGGLEWIALGSHEIVPSIIATPDARPALVGRRDLLVHYRLRLVERDGVFDLTAL